LAVPASHGRTLKTLGASDAEFYREIWLELSRFVQRLRRESAESAESLPRLTELRFGEPMPLLKMDRAFAFRDIVPMREMDFSFSFRDQKQVGSKGEGEGIM
jgi:hypothetical protein